MSVTASNIRCLTYKDVDTQLAAARAIGNFALDSYGRNKVLVALTRERRMSARDATGRGVRLASRGMRRRMRGADVYPASGVPLLASASRVAALALPLRMTGRLESLAGACRD